MMTGILWWHSLPWIKGVWNIKGTSDKNSEWRFCMDFVRYIERRMDNTDKDRKAKGDGNRSSYYLVSVLFLFVFVFVSGFSSVVWI